MTDTKVRRASGSARWALGLVLRKRTCKDCGHPLDIVWLETPEDGGSLNVGRTGGSFSFGPQETFSVSAGYECSGCGRVTKWTGKLIRAAIDSSDESVPEETV